MKVLLVQPPVEDFYDTSIRTYPMGLLCLASKIKDICDVSIADYRHGKKRMLQDHPFPELKPFYLRDGYTPFSLFGSYYRFGISRDEIEKDIKERMPDVVAISSLFTTYVEEALDVAEIAKKVSPGIITVMGGNHPTLFPEHCLASPHVDYVIRGEGETALYKFVIALKEREINKMERIQGLCGKKGDGCFISPPAVEEDIDIIPDRTLVHSGDYRIGKRNYTFFLTSRGCPFHCAFCGKPHVPYRKRSLASIETEIAQCVDLGLEAVDFEDDMLNLDIPFFHAILDRFRGTGINLSAMNGLYAGSLDTPTLDRMHEAGFLRLNLSLVDASKTVLQDQKRLLPPHIDELLDHLDSSPFLTETHFIIGLPSQKPDDVIETMIYLMGKRLLPGPSVYYLAPGSALFDSICGPQWQQHIKDMRSSALFPSSPFFPRETLFTFMKLTRFINFAKSAIDSDPSIKELADIPDAQICKTRPHDAHIVKTLITEKRFLRFDSRLDGYIDEPQDKNLLSRFFEKSRGKTIKGFKTNRNILFDK